MKINFDNISPSRLEPRQSAVSASPIKISIESPVYNEIVRELNPHNYQSELSSMNNVIDLPVEVSRFIQREIEKEMREGEREEKEVSVNFIERTYSTNSIIDKKSSKEEKIEPERPKKKFSQTSTKGKTGWVFNYKKHKCTNPHLTTEVRQTMKDVSEFTGQPSLYPSAFTKKAVENRKSKYETGHDSKPFSVYEHLYLESHQRKIKAELNKTKRINRMPEPQPRTNKNYFQNAKTTYNSLFNRLNEILYNREAKRREKEGLDLTSGRELFVPDTSRSKDSYKLYFHSLSREKLACKKKQKAVDELTSTQKKVRLDQTSKAQLKPKENPVDTKTIQYFTEIFYSQSDLSSSLATSTASNPIRKSQFLVLHPFLYEIEEIQSKKFEMETTASSAKVSTAPSKIKNVLSKEQFQQKLKKYFQKLSLHDRQILRKEVVGRKKSEFHMVEEQIFEKPVSFRPTINARSSSLDNLAKGHSKNIYYI